MGRYGKSYEDVEQILKWTFQALEADPHWLKSFKSTDGIIVYKYTDPDINWWMDTRYSTQGPTGWVWGAGPEPEAFNVRLQMTWDVGHKAWANKLNFLMGITRGQIIIEREASRLLKLAPLQRLTGEIYVAMLKNKGREDLLDFST